MVRRTFRRERFDRLLKSLSQRGWCFGEPNGGEAGKRKLKLTFDDGYQHLREHLPALIEKYQISPIVFVPTGFLGKSNRWDYSYIFRDTPHLGRTAIKELSALGVSFGSHGHTHRPLTTLSGDKLQDELVSSKQTLEEILGVAIDTISYPFGRVDKRVVDAAVDAGYRQGYTMSFPTVADSRMAMGRFAVYCYDTPFTVRQKISGGKLYRLEQLKASVTNKLSYGTGIYRRLSRR